MIDRQIIEMNNYEHMYILNTGKIQKWVAV